MAKTIDGTREQLIVDFQLHVINIVTSFYFCYHKINVSQSIQLSLNFVNLPRPVTFELNPVPIIPKATILMNCKFIAVEKIY